MLPLAVTNPTTLFFNVNFIPSSSLPFSSVLIIFKSALIRVFPTLTAVDSFLIVKFSGSLIVRYPSGALTSSSTYSPNGRYSRVKVPFSSVTIAVASSFLSAKEAKLVPSTFTYFPSALLITNFAPGSAVFSSSANFVTVSFVLLFITSPTCMTLPLLPSPFTSTLMLPAGTYPCGAFVSAIVYLPNGRPSNFTTPSCPLADFLVMPLPLNVKSTPWSSFPSSPFFVSLSVYFFS